MKVYVNNFFSEKYTVEDVVAGIRYVESDYRLDVYVKLDKYKYMEVSDYFMSSMPIENHPSCTGFHFICYKQDDEDTLETAFEIQLPNEDREGWDVMITPLKWEYQLSIIKPIRKELQEAEIEVLI